MVFADFNPPASDGEDKKAAEGGAAGGKADDEDRGAEYVQWMSQPHFRPSVALQRSPFFADVFVDVTDWSFTLWKDGLDTPIFYSPMATSHYTSGRWSLQRPGVLFISKGDGHIDVWDFTDQSHRASLTLNVAPVAICSIEFSPMLSGKRQLLAAGDKTGNLHILDTPMDLMRPHPNENQLMEAFLEREWTHVTSVGARMKVRDEEREVQQKEAEAAAGRDKEPEPEVDPEAAKEELARQNSLYLELEQTLRLELGLELPPGSDEEED